MKAFFAALFLIVSVSSFANDEKLIKACKGAAIDVLQERAERIGDVMDVESIRVDDVDDRIYNPYKYVWFSGKTVNSGKEIIVLMQKRIGKLCHYRLTEITE